VAGVACVDAVALGASIGVSPTAPVVIVVIIIVTPDVKLDPSVLYLLAVGSDVDVSARRLQSPGPDQDPVPVYLLPLIVGGSLT
jgi:hypothetical protein